MLGNWHSDRRYGDTVGGAGRKVFFFPPLFWTICMSTDIYSLTEGVWCI